MQMSFVCHGQQLTRQASGGSGVRQKAQQMAGEVESRLAPPPAAPLFARGGDCRAVEIVPPLNNEHGAQVIETLLASIAGGDTFSLEIAATPDRRVFIARGTPATLDHITQQLRAAYGQVKVSNSRYGKFRYNLLKLASGFRKQAAPVGYLYWYIDDQPNRMEALG